MNQGASSSSSSADQRFTGTGGSEDFQLFENKTLALLEARWGEAAADVWHGKYKDGKEFFTADKINDCKAYIKLLESGGASSSPPTGTEAESLQRMITLLRAYIKGIATKTGAGVASYRALGQKCTKEDFDAAIVDLANNVLAIVIQQVSEDVAKTIWAADESTRKFTIGSTLKTRYGRDASEQITLLKQRMASLQVFKQGSSYRVYQQGDDVKVYFENINALRTKLRSQLDAESAKELDACKDGSIITAAANALGKPYEASYLDWRINGNARLDSAGQLVKDTSPRDLTSFTTRMVAVYQTMNPAASTASASQNAAFLNSGTELDASEQRKPPNCWNESNGGTCNKHKKGNCGFMHRDGKFNPSARRGGGRGRGGKGGRGGGRNGKGNGRGDSGGGRTSAKRKEDDRLRQSLHDRTTNALKAVVSKMQEQQGTGPVASGFDAFEAPTEVQPAPGGNNQVQSFLSQLQDQLASSSSGRGRGKAKRHRAFANPVIIDISSYQNNPEGNLFDGFIGNDTCNSCPYLGDDRSNFLHLSADYDDIKSGVFYKGVGSEQHRVELAGPYCRLINVNGKHVALVIPHAYYAPGCNCRIVGSEYLSAALGWTLVQKYNRTCETNLTSTTGCPHAMWHNGTDGDPDRQLCWLKLRHNLLMIPVLPNSASSIHLPENWPQLVKNQQLIVVRTSKERRALQSSIHKLPALGAGKIDDQEPDYQANEPERAVQFALPPVDRSHGAPRPGGEQAHDQMQSNSIQCNSCAHCGGGYGHTCQLFKSSTDFLRTSPEDYGDHKPPAEFFDTLPCPELDFSIDNISEGVTFSHEDPSLTRSIFLDELGQQHHVLHNLSEVQHTTAFAASSLKKSQAAHLWWRRLGYCPLDDLKQLAKEHATVTFDASVATSNDPIELKARSRTKAYKRRGPDNRPEDLTANGATCSTDHFSGVKIKGIYGATGWFGFNCHKTLYLWAYCCRSRDDYPTILLKHINQLSSQGLRLRKIISDSAPEIIRGQVTQLAAEHDFQISQSSVNGGNSGGMQEVHGGIVARKARALIALARHLPKSTWPCAVYYAVLLINLLPVAKFGGKSRFEMWYGRKADLDAMLIKVYGCPVEYGVPKLLRIKAGGRWRELTRSGYFVGHAGILVLVYDPDLHQIVQVSRQKCFFLEGAYTGSMPPADPHENPARLDKPDEHGRDDDDSCDEAPDVIRSEITHRNVPLDEYKSSIFDQLTTAAGPVFHEDGNSASELRSIENPAAHPRDALQQADNPTHVPVENQRQEQQQQQELQQRQEQQQQQELQQRQEQQQQPQLQQRQENQQPQVQEPERDELRQQPRGQRRKRACQSAQQPRRSARLRHEPRSDKQKVSAFATFLLSTILAASVATLEHDIDAYKKLPTPKNLADALMAPDWKGWIGAYRSELSSWLKNNVFCKVNKKNLPAKTKVFFVMDVLKRKWRADNGMLDKLKVRAVLSGNLFVRGVHCATSTFAPCVSALSVRMFLAICAATSTIPSSLDVETAFLHGIETHEVYAHYPVYFRMAEASLDELQKIRDELLAATGPRLAQLRRSLNSKVNPSENFVMKMLKSGYGSPSASKAYYAKWVSVMALIGMSTSVVDSCVYYKFWPQSGDWLIALCWCDDVPFTGTTKAKKWFVEQVKKHLPITFNEVMTTFLGFEIKYHKNGSTSMHCGELLTNIGSRFSEYLPEHHKTMPAPAGYVPKAATPEEHQKAKHLPFAAIIGCLQYVCGWVRFDGLTALSMLSQHTCNRWNLEHFYAAVHLLSYLLGTKDIGNYWSTSDRIHGSMKPYAFSDADLATDPSRRSRSAIALMMNGGPLYCKSFLQTVIQLSTCCSEIIAAAQTSIDLKGVRNLLSELGFAINGPSKQYCDNKAAVQVINSEASLSQSTKHLEMRYLMVRQLVASGIILLAFVKTENNLSDILSKNLGRILFTKFRDAILGLNHHLHGHIFKQ